MQLNTATLLALLGLVGFAFTAPTPDSDHVRPPFPCSHGKEEDLCERRVDRMRVQRFEGADCDDHKMGPVGLIEPYHCMNFKKWGAFSLKYVLAETNKKDRCDTTFYRGKLCSGKVVKKILGNETYVPEPQCLKEKVGSIMVDNCE